MKTHPVKQATSSVRILKRASCPSLSEKSHLGYEVGVNDRHDVQIHIASNSASGAFNTDWVSLRSIEAAFDKVPRGEPVTSDVLVPLFRGMSQNTPGFFFAILKHAGYVKLSETKKRCYDRVEPTAFKAEVQALMEGRTPTQTDTKPKKNAGKKAAPAKTPSASTKKTK
jgi:hypothetical protein